MPTATQSRQLKSTLGDLLRSLEDGEKSAAQKKKAEDVPGYEGATSHPSKSVDDGTQTAPTGSHYAENETRVKEDEPLGVPDATPNDTGSQNEVQVDMGLTSKTTGTDPSVERDVKDRPEDPGTSSEVDTSVGEKYSSQRKEFDTLVKNSEATGSAFLAVLNKLAGGNDAVIQGKMGAPAMTPTDEDPAKTPPPALATKDAAAGYEFAGAIAALPEEDKEATVKGINNIVKATIERAVNMATKTAEYLYGLEAGLKQAEGEEEAPPPEEGSEGGGGGPPASDEGGGGGGGMPPEMGGGGGGGAGGLSEEDLIQLLLQGEQMGGAGGGGMPGGGGGGDLGALAGGGGGGGGGMDALLAGAGGGAGGDMGGGGGEMPPEMGGGGGMPPEGGGGGGGGEVDPAMLEAILQEMGANSGQLEKAMAAKQAAARQAAARAKQNPALKTAAAKTAENRKKFGPKYDQVKKAVADLLGRRVA